MGDESLGKACVRKCKLKCDAGFEALDGIKDAVCLRSSKIWVKPISVCVPENFENDGSVVIKAPDDVGWKGEFDMVDVAEIEAAIAPTEAPTEAPTAAPTEAPTPAPEEDRAEFDEEAADRAEKEKKKKEKKKKKGKKKKKKKKKKK